MLEFKQIKKEDKEFLADIGTKFVEVEKLLPYAKNSRKHDEEQITNIATSIMEFKFLNPIIVDAKRGVIAGHGRLMGAKKIGLKYVPVVDGSHLTEPQRKAYVIADNQIAQNSTWDLDILKSELGDLKEDGLIDLDLLGFDGAFLENLVGEELDMSVLDEIKESGEVIEYERGLKKSVNVEFDIDDYPEAFDLIKYFRGTRDLGKFMLQLLRNAKACEK